MNQMKLKTIIWILIAIFAVFLIYKWVASIPKPYTSSPVHWHADFQLIACGKSMNLPRVPVGAGHLGGGLLHTHDDNKVHLEGQIWKKEDARIKTFIDAINLDRFVKDNGCSSPITEVLVDNMPEDVNHVISDGEVIKVTYGSA